MSTQSLRHLGPGNFAIVMGLVGLGLAWRRAEALLGPPALQVAAAVAALALAVFLLLSGAALWRAWRYPEAWAADLRHPVRHAFVAALPIALLLLATLGHALGLPGMLMPWLLACAAQLAVTLWVLQRLLRGPRPWHAGLTPVLIIPVVGNVLAPLAGVGLGLRDVALAQFLVGAILWPLVLGLLALRWRRQGLWPERLLPTGFITVAPPSVIGLAALQLGASPGLAWGAWSLAFGFLVLNLPLLPRIARQPFALPFWAMSFPLAAFTALSLRLGLTTLALALLAATSLLVLGLLLASWRAWRAGRLWVGE